MKKIIFIIVTSLFFIQMVRAQQTPYYTQYVMNNFIVNPAVAGIENYWDVKLSHRMQWVGLRDAPETTYLTLHGPLNKKEYIRSNSTSINSGINPRGYYYWNNYKPAKPHHGAGVTILNDKTGPLTRFAAYGTYAYHIGISNKTSLSAGISAGITRISIDETKLKFGTSTADPVVSGSDIINHVNPDISTGIWLYSAKYFAGLSIEQIISRQLLKENKVHSLAFTAGYRMQLSDDVSVLPSVMVRQVNILPTGGDMNIKFQYRDVTWIGGSWRYQDGFAVMAGLNISSTVNVGYSYDMQTSGINKVSNGTHEILIGLMLNNKNEDRCPQNLW